MSDEQNTASTEGSTTETPPEGAAKTFDADYVDKLRKEAAKYRTEAKANSSAAARLAEIEEASKTAEQKATERLALMEAQAEALQAKVVQAEIASTTGIPTELLAGPESTAPEDVKAFADKLIAHIGANRSKGNIVPTEGKNPTPTDDPMRDFARQVFKRD